MMSYTKHVILKYKKGLHSLYIHRNINLFFTFLTPDEEILIQTMYSAFHLIISKTRRSKYIRIMYVFISEPPLAVRPSSATNKIRARQPKLV